MAVGVRTTDVDDALMRLRRSGAPITTPRRALVEVLYHGPPHRTANELAADVRRSADVNVSTVYRNLEELERLGIVVRSRPGHGAALYDIADNTNGQLVCLACSAIIAVPDATLQVLRSSLHEQLGFCADPGRTIIGGRCRRCGAPS